jgi:hypothetical protein
MRSVLGTLLLVATVGCSMATQRPTLINPTFGIAARRPGDSPADGCHLFARQPKERLRTDAVVRVYSPRGECSGALVGPDLVLTAGHCVTEPEPYAHYVEFGEGAPWARIGVAEIVAVQGKSLDGQDVALLVLSRSMDESVTPLEVSFDRLGEDVQATRVGFGGEPERTTVRLGPVLSDLSVLYMPGLARHGDSGGPVLDAGGKVIGLITAFADTDGGPFTIATRVDGHVALFARARSIGREASPPTPDGAACGRSVHEFLFDGDRRAG